MGCYGITNASRRDGTYPQGLCDIGHQGLMHDEEVGLVYNRARELAPTMGRFMQRDPSGYVQGSSVVEICKSNLISYRDPEGLVAGDDTPAADWWRQWLKDHGLIGDKDAQLFASTFRRGCVGITCLNLGEPEWPDTQNCFKKLAQAQAQQKKMTENCECSGQKNMYGDPSSPKLFSIHFASKGKPYAPDQDGRVDMSSWDHSAAEENLTNFDYGWFDEASGKWIHADRGSQLNDHTLNFTVLTSSLQDWQGKKEGAYIDFDKEVFCVACEDWKLPKGAKAPHYLKKPKVKR